MGLHQPIDGESRRLHRETRALEMLAGLDAQARKIFHVADEAAHGRGLRSFPEYRAFRRTVAEFESFCNVIESHLSDVAGSRRHDVEDRFYRLWAAIHKPVLGALHRFFAAVAEKGELPLGAQDELAAELRSLAGTRSVLATSRLGQVGDGALQDRITALETLIMGLIGQATTLPELVPIAPVSLPAPRPAASVQVQPSPPLRPTTGGDSADLRAARELRKWLLDHRREPGFAPYVAPDLRAAEDIEQMLTDNPMDGAAVAWLPQIGSTWSSRLRDGDKDLRHISALIHHTA